MNIIYFLLTCYGLTMIIVQSLFMKPFRELFYNIPFLYKLFSCMMCTGFWIGALLSLIMTFSPTFIMLQGDKNILYNILDGAFTSGGIWLIYLFQLNLERHVEDKL